MLHTLYSISAINTVELENHAYTVFDSTTFRSNMNMETSFLKIGEDFLRLWNNTIKPFIDYIYNDDGFYNKPVRPAFTIEESVFAKIQGMDLESIRGYYINKNVRIFSVPNMRSNFAVVNSLAYSNITQTNNHVISIFLSNEFLRDKELKNDHEMLNKALFRILHICATEFMDYKLSIDHGVPVNRTLSKMEGSNKGIIILPEFISAIDAKFVFYYYYTLFYIIQSATNIDIIRDFSDYLNMTDLPLMFLPRNCNEESSEEELVKDITRIYKDIWDIADASVNRKENCITDSKLVDICVDIMLSIRLNIDNAYYDTSDYDLYEESDEDNEET